MVASMTSRYRLENPEGRQQLPIDLDSTPKFPVVVVALASDPRAIDARSRRIRIIDREFDPLSDSNGFAKALVPVGEDAAGTRLALPC